MRVRVCVLVEQAYTELLLGRCSGPAALPVQITLGGPMILEGNGVCILCASMSWVMSNLQHLDVFLLMIRCTNGLTFLC